MELQTTERRYESIGSKKVSSRLSDEQSAHDVDKTCIHSLIEACRIHRHVATLALQLAHGMMSKPSGPLLQTPSCVVAFVRLHSFVRVVAIKCSGWRIRSAIDFT
jgi:hypothetical protein